MQIIIDLRSIKSYDLFEFIITKKKRGNLFYDLRDAFKNQVSRIINKDDFIKNDDKSETSKIIELNPLKSKYPPQEYLDVKFCIYCGTSDYSLKAINYQHGDVLPCIKTFYDLPYYSIGSFDFQISAKSCSVNILVDSSIRMVGYSYETNQKYKKPHFSLYGVYFDKNYLKDMFDKYINLIDYKNLEEIRIGMASFPAIFMCRNTGKLFSCTCFKDYVYDWYWDFYRYTGLDISQIKTNSNPYNIEFIDGICSICTKKKPDPIYEFSGISGFLKRYLPYYKLYVRANYHKNYILSNTPDGRKIENEVRRFFKYPEFGEKWKSETSLYKTIRILFPSSEVIFHYRGEEMGGLEIDIFLPDKKIGIEYQGEQHFKAISCWGGQEGLDERMLHDQRKRILCKNNGYLLIYFSYQEPLSFEYVRDKLEKEGVI